MAVIKCKMCGGDIELSADKTFGTCEYCGSTMTFPKNDDEQRTEAFNRGNHFRRIGEFDKALTVYERIVQEDGSDAEAHWCCALCRFGIEYVKDPASGEYLPTCHRASFDSFLEDVDYLAALEHSDGITRRQYQKDAAKIAEVQRGILATSLNEAPFDVFICYKESDNNGGRTVDSTLAQDIYFQLTEQGRRVFFSRITLEDKAGMEYEPYIFAALNSAKVMIAVGTKPEHFNAVWVKNEWSRFLTLMKKDRRKLLIPCYRGMDPYDLPEQLSVLQSYDMGKIGFIQDLIRGVSKVLDAGKTAAAPVKENAVVQNEGGSNLTALLKRGYMSLEDGEWQKADDFFEQVLNMDAECARAYLGKSMAEMEVPDLDCFQQKCQESPLGLSENKNLQLARRFARGELQCWFDQMDAKGVQITESWKQEGDALIARADELVGETGAILTMESKNVDTRIDVLPGMWLKNGLISYYFVTDPEEMVAIYDDVPILLTDWQLDNIFDIVPLLEQVVQNGKSIVIMAREISGDSLATLLLNKLRGVINVACIEMGDCDGRLMNILQDIAAVTGGQIISEELGYDLKKTNLSMLGRCRRIRSESYRSRMKSYFSVIVGTPDRDQAVNNRITELRNQMECTQNDGERTWLLQRIERLASGVAMIRLAGGSEAEVEVKLRYMDAALESRMNRVNGITPLTDEELEEKDQTIQRNLVEEAIKKSYPAGFVTVEDSNTAFSDVVNYAGMKLNQGYFSPYLVSDTENMESVMDDAYIFISDQKISSIAQILRVPDPIMRQGVRSVIFAEDFSDEVLDILIKNHKNNVFHVQCISVAGFGFRRKEILEDIAIVTGGVLISSALEEMSESEQFSCLGRARKVIVTKTNTSIIGGAGDRQEIWDRIHQLREEIINAPDEGIRKELHERQERLACGAVVIKVGGDTEYMVLERYRSIKALLEERLKQSAPSGETLMEQRRQEELKWAEDLKREKAAEEEAERLRALAEEEAMRRRREQEAEAERQRETERQREAERQRRAKIAALDSEKRSLKTELANLRGLFTGKRRKEIEYRLAEIDAELKKI